MRDELAGVEAERVVVDAAELPEEEAEEDGACEDIEDAVPDHLGGDGDDVAALSARPGDRVGNQHEREVACSEVVAPADNTASCEARGRRLPEDDGPIEHWSGLMSNKQEEVHIPKVDERDDAEGVVTPLVGAVDEGTD